MRTYAPTHVRFRRLTASICCLFLLLAGKNGHAELPLIQIAEPDHVLRDRKTLFDWDHSSTALMRQATEADDDPDPFSDALVTDRPHVSEASSLVGLGVAQLELGYTIARDWAGDTRTRAQAAPEGLLRVGMFAEWFELRLGENWLTETTLTSDQPQQSLSGFDDAYLACKLALTPQQGWLPEVALFPQLRVPVGAHEFTSNKYLPGYNLAYSWVITPNFEIECNSQLNQRVDDLGDVYAEVIQTVNLEFQLTEQLGAFTEWFVFAPHEARVARTQHYFHTGLVYLITPDIQWDAHIAWGMNDAANDLAFTGTGLSVRF